MAPSAGPTGPGTVGAAGAAVGAKGEEGTGDGAAADGEGRPGAALVVGTSAGWPGGAAHPAQSRAASAKAVDAARHDPDVRPPGTKPARDKTRAMQSPGAPGTIRVWVRGAL